MTARFVFQGAFFRSLSGQFYRHPPFIGRQPVRGRVTAEPVPVDILTFDQGAFRSLENLAYLFPGHCLSAELFPIWAERASSWPYPLLDNDLQQY